MNYLVIIRISEFVAKENPVITTANIIQEDAGKSENESGKCVRTLERCSSLNEISVLCNIPVLDTVRVSELSKLLRVDKQSLKDILEVFFSDGRIILDNLLEVCKSC